MDDRIVFLGSAYALRDSGVTGLPARCRAVSVEASLRATEGVPIRQS